MRQAQTQILPNPDWLRKTDKKISIDIYCSDIHLMIYSAGKVSYQDYLF
jgi:hypothetical protein